MREDEQLRWSGRRGSRGGERKGGEGSGVHMNSIQLLFHLCKEERDMRVGGREEETDNEMTRSLNLNKSNYSY